MTKVPEEDESPFQSNNQVQGLAKREKDPPKKKKRSTQNKKSIVVIKKRIPKNQPNEIIQ